MSALLVAFGSLLRRCRSSASNVNLSSIDVCDGWLYGVR